MSELTSFIGDDSPQPSVGVRFNMTNEKTLIAVPH